MSPGLAVDKHILSSRDLANFKPAPHLWSPAEAMECLNRAGWAGELTHPAGWTESLAGLLCWGCKEVERVLVKGMYNHKYNSLSNSISIIPHS